MNPNSTSNALAASDPDGPTAGCKWIKPELILVGGQTSDGKAFVDSVERTLIYGPYTTKQSAPS